MDQTEYLLYYCINQGRSQFFFFEFFSFVPTSWGNTSIYKLENKSRSSKIVEKHLMFERKFGFDHRF